MDEGHDGAEKQAEAQCDEAEFHKLECIPAVAAELTVCASQPPRSTVDSTKWQGTHAGRPSLWKIKDDLCCMDKLLQ